MRDKLCKNLQALSLEHRLLVLMCLIGLGVSLVGAVENFCLGMSNGAVALCLLLFFLTAGMLFLLHRTHRYALVTHISLALLTLLIMPLMWFLSGGLEGSMPYYYLMMVFCSVILLNGYRYQYYVLALQTLLLIALVAIGILHPQWVQHYPSHSAQVVDVIVALLLFLIMIGLMLNRFMKEYHRILNQTQESYEMLQVKNEALYYLNMQDALTGVSNRRYIYAKLTELQKSEDACPLVLAMFDIDHFKHVNDVYGHAFGDQVLKTVGKFLNQSMGEEDYFARVGGEEFLAVFPHADLEERISRVNAMLREIEQMEWDTRELRVTVSAGIHRADSLDDIDQSIKAADEALYEAKETGRNRLVCR